MTKLKYLGLIPVVSGAISPYLLLAIGIVIFITAILSVIYDTDSSGLDKEEKIINFFTGAATIGATAMVGFGPIIPFLILGLMLHVLLAELYLFF